MPRRRFVPNQWRRTWAVDGELIVRKKRLMRWLTT